MGGYGSGSWYRWSKKTYTNDCRALDVNRMVKLGAIPKCGWRSGTWIWTNSETGEQVSSIGYVANTQDPQNMTLRIHYTVTDTQEKFDYKIRLTVTSTPFGGKRLWFICPYTGRRVARLYRPCGGNGYASRHANRLAYASQSETAGDRAIRRKWKLQNKLGGQDFPRRPKGMHRKTYERLFNEVMEAEDVVDRHLIKFMTTFSHRLEARQRR